MEGDLVVAADTSLVLRIMNPAVVERAQESSPGEVGVAVAGPGVVVVGVAHRRWCVAAAGGATAIADTHRDPLGRGEVPLRSSHVERLTVAAEDNGDDAGLAREAACVAALIRSPVSSVAAARPSLSESRVIVTTTVAFTPPAL
ncbi:hypothetical protein, partial [uncultured Nocardioides sp.]|uniref:hypothetical protein n=1 Tax=uncultured Nocardioides sp. TaxID=198441 RepID=UPI0030F5C6F6